MTARMQRGCLAGVEGPGREDYKGGHRGEEHFRRASKAILQTLAFISGDIAYSHICQFFSHICLLYHVTVTFQKNFLI